MGFLIFLWVIALIIQIIYWLSGYKPDR